METMFEWIFRLFLILLAVLWVCLPFALFGTWLNRIYGYAAGGK